MPEDNKDRDKAVEEALEAVGWPIKPLINAPENEVAAMRLLWQRAQEAEREENCKAVCEYCKRGVPVEQRKGRWFHPTVGWTCDASPIRNRAARASEEPKP